MFCTTTSIILHFLVGAGVSLSCCSITHLWYIVQYSKRNSFQTDALSLSLWPGQFSTQSNTLSKNRWKHKCKISYKIAMWNNKPQFWADFLLEIFQLLFGCRSKLLLHCCWSLNWTRILLCIFLGLIKFRNFWTHFTNPAHMGFSSPLHVWWWWETDFIINLYKDINFDDV